MVPSRPRPRHGQRLLGRHAARLDGLPQVHAVHILHHEEEKLAGLPEVEDLAEHLDAGHDRGLGLTEADDLDRVADHRAELGVANIHAHLPAARFFSSPK